MTHITIDTLEYGDPRIREASEHVSDSYAAAFAWFATLGAHMRDVSFTPIWLADVAWPFPTWRVRARPFDWAEDEADIPVSAEDRWHRGDRRRFKLYLRPPREVVQR